MYKKLHSVYRVLYYPRYQASTMGFGIYPLWIREMTVFYFSVSKKKKNSRGITPEWKNKLKKVDFTYWTRIFKMPSTLEANYITY